MAEYIFLRYGNRPNPQVTAALGPIVKPGTNIPFTTLPGIMITGFKSDLTEEEIAQKLSHLNIKYDLVKKQDAEATTAAPASPAGPKTKVKYQAEIQAAIDVEDFEKATTLRNEMNAAYPDAPEAPATDVTEEGMITNIAQFKAIFEKDVINGHLNGHLDDETEYQTDRLVTQYKEQFLYDIENIFPEYKDEQFNDAIEYIIDFIYDQEDIEEDVWERLLPALKAKIENIIW